VPLIDHFSLIAPFYDNAIPLRYMEKIVTTLDLPVRGAILDAGGGTGRVADALRTYAGCIIVGDLSLGMLRQARKKGHLSLACFQSEKLPFPDMTFERIIMIDTLHHVYDQPATCTQLWRVLQPGGRILILEPDIHRLSVKFVALLEKLALMRSQFMSAKRIGSLFDHKNAQFRIDIEGFNAWITVDKIAY
jgi:demethylmenaquinone methyltransferase/2-methoxy-6-polyprenyl-1,4-benzoquinol methylase